MRLRRTFLCILLMGGATLPRPALAQEESPASHAAVPIIERSDDDLVLVQLRLGRMVLSESVAGYFNKNHLMLPLGQIASALQFEIKVNPPEGQADGWFMQLDNSFTLDVARREAVITGNRQSFSPEQVEVHKDDIYVDTALLSKWWPVDFNFSFATQTVTVSGQNGILLPVERDAAREKARAALAGKPPEFSGPLPRIDAPYQAYSMPYADLDYTAGLDQQANVGPHNGITALVNNDLFYMHSSLYLAADSAQKVTDFRWNLSRRDPDGALFKSNEWLGRTSFGELLNEYSVNDLEFGDINTQQLPLTAFNQQGRGFMVSNIPYDRATQYNRTTLQGDIQTGWEVELYRNDELLSFQRATANGRYEFVDVPLLSGLNILRLVFYGPFGQTREETRRFLVTPNLTQAGKSYFRYSFSQQNTSAFDIENQNLSAATLSGATPLQSEIIKGKPRSLFEYEYGILDNLSLFANHAFLTTPDDVARNYLSTGLATSLYGLYTRADVAHDVTGGGNGAELLLQGNAWGVSLSGDSQLFREGYISEFTETIDDPVTSRTTARGDMPLQIPYLPHLNIGVSDSYITYTSGRVVDEVVNRVSTSIARVSLSHVLTYRSDTSPQAVPLVELFPTTGLPTNTQTVTPYDKQTTGELIVNIPFNRLTLRGDALYGITPKGGVQTLISAAEYALNTTTNTIFQVDKQLVDLPLTTYTVTLNRRFDKFLVGASVSHSDNGKNAAGINVALAIGENPRTGGFEMYPENTARDGMIAVRAFHDSNGNGTFDDGETPIEDATFLVNHGSSNPTDADGAALLRNVTPDTRARLSLDGTSLGNPYLLNNVAGYDVVTRPGVPVLLDFPVASSGDLEGTVYIEEKGNRQEAANVTLQVVTGDGKVVKETRTGFDGYYLLNALPTGAYSLRVSPEQATRLGFKPMQNRAFIITSNEDGSHTMDLVVKR